LSELADPANRSTTRLGRLFPAGRLAMNRRTLAINSSRPISDSCSTYSSQPPCVCSRTNARGKANGKSKAPIQASGRARSCSKSWNESSNSNDVIVRMPPVRRHHAAVIGFLTLGVLVKSTPRICSTFNYPPAPERSTKKSLLFIIFSCCEGLQRVNY